MFSRLQWPYTTGNYNETQANAVALLMRDLGYASHMSYSTVESGTADINMIGALWTNFGYDKYIRILERDYCTAEDFNAILRSELDAQRPVLMSGANDGGHTYVCDGYDERGYFHINYGWAGYQDNYYLIGTDMPYSMSLNIFLGIQPNKTGTESKNGITAGYRYYTLNGHKLNGKPNQPGIYIVRPANGSPHAEKAWKIIVK